MGIPKNTTEISHSSFLSKEKWLHIVGIRARRRGQDALVRPDLDSPARGWVLSRLHVHTCLWRRWQQTRRKWCYIPLILCYCGLEHKSDNQCCDLNKRRSTIQLPDGWGETFTVKKLRTTSFRVHRGYVVTNAQLVCIKYVSTSRDQSTSWAVGRALEKSNH